MLKTRSNKFRCNFIFLFTYELVYLTLSILFVTVSDYSYNPAIICNASVVIAFVFTYKTKVIPKFRICDFSYYLILVDLLLSIVVASYLSENSIIENSVLFSYLRVIFFAFYVWGAKQVIKSESVCIKSIDVSQIAYGVFAICAIPFIQIYFYTDEKENYIFQLLLSASFIIFIKINIEYFIYLYKKRQENKYFIITMIVLSLTNILVSVAFHENTILLFGFLIFTVWFSFMYSVEAIKLSE